MDTNEDFYYPYGIKYKGLKLLDVAQTNIKMHFVDVAHFIDDALSSGGKNHLFVSILFMCSSFLYGSHLKKAFEGKKTLRDFK